MFSYGLPKELIAQHPCEPRDVARLLVLDRRSERLTHRIFRDFPEYLRPGDCLVLNDTKVIPARFLGRTATGGGKVGLLLLRPETEKGDVSRNVPFSTYWCLGQPAKRLKPGIKLLFDHGSLQAEILSWNQGERLVRFEGDGVDQVLTKLGEIPLPPYIRRPVEPQDAQWYQTVYAQRPGAVAAPTAGLHFTPELLDRIREHGVRIAFVTLHVGWGTFKPVGEKELASGRLYPERFEIPLETLETIRQTKRKSGRIVAVGTTVVRALETWAMGDAEEIPPAARSSADPSRIIEERVEDCPSTAGGSSEGGRTRGPLTGATDLFIRPPFEFKVIDAMITNFHLPGTSLLYLVAAFAGENQILAAYEEAIRQRYRFYSYGDAMFIQ